MEYDFSSCRVIAQRRDLKPNRAVRVDHRPLRAALAAAHRQSAVRPWDTIFPDATMTLAAVDRLVHRATIFELNVESYRRRTAMQRRAAVQPAAGTGPAAASDTPAAAQGSDDQPVSRPLRNGAH